MSGEENAVNEPNSGLSSGPSSTDKSTIAPCCLVCQLPSSQKRLRCLQKQFGGRLKMWPNSNSHVWVIVATLWAKILDERPKDQLEIQRVYKSIGILPFNIFWPTVKIQIIFIFCLALKINIKWYWASSSKRIIKNTLNLTHFPSVYKRVLFILEQYM